MEAWLNQGQTYDDKRLPSRPQGSGVPSAFENFGVTLKPTKTTVNGDAKSGSQASSSQTRPTAGQSGKFKPARLPSPKPQKKYSSTQSTAGSKSKSASRSTSGQDTRPLKGVADSDSESDSSSSQIRPTARQSGKPKAKHSSTQSTARSKSNGVSSSTSKQGTQRPKDSDSDSADEMDLLSQADVSDDPSTSQKPVTTKNKFKPAVSTTAAKPGQKSNLGQKQESKNAKEMNAKETRVYVDPNGKEHQYHHQFLPKKNLNTLRFKKNKDSNQDETANVSSFSLQPTKSQEPISKENVSWDAYEPPSWTDAPSGSSLTRKEPERFMDLTSPPKHAREDDSVVHAKHPSPLSGKSANSNRRISPSPPRSRQPVPGRKPATYENATEGVRYGPPVGRPKLPRPKPRPTARVALDMTEAQSSQPKNAPCGPGRSQTRGAPSLTKVLDMIPVGNVSQRRETTEKKQETRGRSRSRSPSLELFSPRPIKKTGIDEFPAPSPPSSPPRPSSFPMMSPLRGAEESPKPPGRSSKPLAKSSRKPDPFPMPLPQVGRREESKAKTHVNPSKDKPDKGKSKAKETSWPSDEDDNYSDNYREKKKPQTRKPKLKAFPMSTQVLASIGASDAPSSSTLPSRSSRPGKRTSEGGSEDERTSKKSRMERDALLESPTRLPFEDEGDSICIAPHVDPRTLCPYCDMPLPSNPTPLLVKILAATKKKAQRDPRPSNPLGLKAPLATFITVCQRHRFESQILPEAERKGWPKTIKWKEVSGRVLKMKPFLKALIDDTGDDDMEESDSDKWEVLFGKDDDSKKKGPKARSIFWTDVMDEVKKKGLRAVSGVRGQFANFEKTQPGYYGELGSVIIHQTLYNMFPPSEMDPDSISPLTSNEVVQRVLVPEVALHLIMEDQGLEGDEGMEEALEILRDSSSYGVAMFPEDGGEWGGNKKRGDEDKMGAGDLIVMERARKRRKELEEEDEREEEERRLLEAKQQREAEMEAKEKEMRDKKKKGTGKQKSDPAGDSSEVNEPAERPRPRPRPRQIMKDSSSKSLLSSQEPDQEPQNRSSRSRTRSRGSSIHIDNAQRASSEEMRRSPSASASRKPEDILPVLATRAASRGMAGLSLESDSDTSNKAVVNAKLRGRSRSRARSTSVRAKRKEQSSDRMDTAEDNDSDDEVEISEVLNAKTPIQKRRHTVEIDDESDHEDTPKAAPAQKAFYPLLAARGKVGTGSHGSAAGHAQQSKSSSKATRHPQRSTDDRTTYSDYPSDTDGKGNKGSSLRKEHSNSWLLSDISTQ